MRLIAVFLLCAVSAYGQGSQTPIYNGLLQSDLDADGFKILTANLADYAGTGLSWNVATNKFDVSSIGAGTVTSITATTPMIVTPDPIVTTGDISLDPTYVALWTDAYGDRLKWDGGATGLTAATGRTSLGLVIGTNVEAWLGNPSVTGYVLSSTTGGVRSWIAAGGGGAPTTTDYLVGTADAGLSAEIVVGTSPGGELGGTWASPTLDDSVTVASWTLTTPTIAAISNLTGNGFVKTSGGIGTLSVDTATYQPSDADLTTWAGVTPTSGIQTWLATPSSANLRGAVTDENGTGVLLFSGATSPIFAGATQFWNGTTSSGEIRILEDSDLGANYASFKVPDLAAITAYTLPPDDGNSGDFLRSDGAGILTWVAPAGGGNVSNSGTPTVDQLGIWVTATTIKGLTTLPATNFPALTGDVTTTAGALATTIGANKVTLGMMATMATDSILGRKTASTGNVEVLTALPWADTGDVTRAADGAATVLAAGNAGNLNSGTLLAARMPAFTGEVTSAVGTVANTIADGVTVANWTLTTPTIAAISNLTGNGFVKTSGGIGTLSIDTSTYLTTATAASTYQPLDGDLTELAAITGAQGDVIYHNGTDWVDLAPGTNGNQLTTHGAGANPTWDAPGSGGSGTVTSSGPPTADQLPIWTTGTNLKGVTGVTGGSTGQVLKKNSATDYDWAWAADASGGVGTPGGSDTQVQFNDAGSLNGDSALVLNKTTDMVTVAGQQTITFDNTDYTNTGGANSHLLLSNPNASGQNNLSSYINGGLRAKMRSDGSGNINWVSYGTGGTSGHHFFVGGDYSVGYDELAIFAVSRTMAVPSSMIFGWASSDPLALSPGDIDTAFKRNAAGVMEINNGTAGQYRDLKVDEVDAVTGYKLNGTTINLDYSNTSVTNQTPSTSDVYLAGSNIVLPAGGFKANGQYRCLFDIVKSAGTGTIVLTVRIGTLGTTGDTNRMTFTFPAGTSVADTGSMEVIVNFRTVGGGTSAVISGLCRARKNTVTAAGLWNTTAAAFTIVGTVSSGFDSSAATTIGCSFNGGTAFSGTITSVQSNLFQK